jgi:hypothetical protein
LLEVLQKSPDNSKRALQKSPTDSCVLQLDRDYDTHVDPTTRTFRDKKFRRNLLRLVAEAAAVALQRVRVSRALL